MVKNLRQEVVKRLISEHEIETQEELIARLGNEGYSATQATISRDIRELKISKVLGRNGKYHYSMAGGGRSHSLQNPYIGAVVNVDHANNLVIIKTRPGLAQAVAAGIDSMENGEILGCVAGDDTIIAVARDNDIAASFCENIQNMVSNA